ncbi:MAG: RNA methyltransferase [Methylococcaceae bacterium]
MAILPHLRIVLVETTHPGNIGATARAMKNMGLADLALVNPKIFPSSEAVARASGADDVLDNAQVFATLHESIADCGLVIGASARLRSISWPQLDPQECARLVSHTQTPTAILFGREHSGLTNDELERCHYLLHIPCDSEFSSLNVAAAVQILAYELRKAAVALDVQPAATERATGLEMESFFGHLESTLYALQFLHPRKNTPSITRRLRRIFNRAQLESAEIHLLRGILSVIGLRIKSEYPDRDAP